MNKQMNSKWIYVVIICIKSKIYSQDRHVHLDLVPMLADIIWCMAVCNTQQARLAITIVAHRLVRVPTRTNQSNIKFVSFRIFPKKKILHPKMYFKRNHQHQSHIIWKKMSEKSRIIHKFILISVFCVTSDLLFLLFYSFKFKMLRKLFEICMKAISSIKKKCEKCD